MPRLTIGLSGLALGIFLMRGPSEATPVVERPVVLVELFTSEGCSSCPPADRLLGKLVERFEPVEVVPLAFHVDYWNYLGWRDRFSSGEHTARQRRYAAALERGRVYTPQLVVDGATGLIGSDGMGARRAIVAASRQSKIRLAISAVAQDGKLQVTLSVPGDARLDRGAEAFFALTEDGLYSEITRGENAGRRLDHVAVVRHLQQLGDLEELAPDGDRRRKTITLRLDPAWRAERLHAVAWIQKQRQGRVLGVARTALSDAARQPASSVEKVSR